MGTNRGPSDETNSARRSRFLHDHTLNKRRVGKNEIVVGTSTQSSSRTTFTRRGQANPLDQRFQVAIFEFWRRGLLCRQIQWATTTCISDIFWVHGWTIAVTTRSQSGEKKLILPQIVSYSSTPSARTESPKSRGQRRGTSDQKTKSTLLSSPENPFLDRSLILCPK